MVKLHIHYEYIKKNYEERLYDYVSVQSTNRLFIDWKIAIHYLEQIQISLSNRVLDIKYPLAGMHFPIISIPNNHNYGQG